MSVVIDAKYRQDWTVIDVPAGGGSPTFKAGTILTVRKDEVQAFFGGKGLDSPGSYTGASEDLTSLTVQAPFGKLKMRYVLNGDGNGTAEDLADKTTLQAIKAATPPITKPTHGGGGSDITGLVVFLAVIVGFVAFLNEKKL
jgi:hypothetical protein